jgi:hypothetical protein
MKALTNIIVLGVLTMALNTVNAQSIVDNYKTFDIRNSSCEVINSVNIELGKSAYNNAFISLRNNEQAKYPFQTQNNIDGYISDFNLTLSNTKKLYESQEFLWKTGKEIGKYGLSVLGNYAQALPTKHLTNFLTPAIKKGYELFVNNEIQKGVDEHKNDIDKIITDRINLLYTNGVDVTTANDEKAFTDMFALAHSEIPALNTEQYAMFNKKLTKRAYELMGANRAQMQLLDLRTTHQYEEVKQQVNSKIEDFQKKITDDVNTKFKELGNSIAELAENQVAIFKTLDNIQERVRANEVKIAALEKDMLRFKNDVEQLRALQEEHSKLIAQNAFQIDILSGYTFQNLNTTQKINALEKGHFDNIFKATEKQKLLAELKDIKDKETIISVSNSIATYSSLSYEALVRTGILKGDAAKNVGKFISAVSLLTGVARVYAGDISGLTSIVSGLGGLFGGEPKPSPEMQMLTQMYEVMNQRFDRIDQHLDIIETKLDTLASITINMYKTMVLSFQYTGNQLERINWKVDNLNQKASALLFKDYPACELVKRVFKERNVTFNSYSDYKKYLIQPCRQCLQAITDFTNRENRDNIYFQVKGNGNLENEQYVEFEIKDIYNPTRDLFKVFYSENINNAMYALMFPVNYTKDVNKPLYYLSHTDSLKLLSSKDVIEEYYNYPMINEFSNIALMLGNYLLIGGNNNNFEPLSLEEYLSSNDINGINQDVLEIRFTSLLNIVQYAISQQSLLSGNLMLDPIYSTLFSYSTDENAKNRSIEVLNNNKLLATNFAIYIINKNLDFSDTAKVQRLYLNASTDNKSLDTLNSLVTLNDIKFKVDTDTKNIQLTFDRKGQTINLICPDFTSILENKMINSEAIYSLLDSRQKINSKLIDLTFTKNLQTTNSMSEKFKYYYNTTSK